MIELLAAALAASLMTFLALASYMGWLPVQVLALYAFASAVTFILYAIDKSAAKRGRWRMPENTLHFWSLAGGWPGAVAAQQLLRHKTRKTGFLVLFWLCAAANCAGLYALWRTLG